MPPGDSQIGLGTGVRVNHKRLPRPDIPSRALTCGSFLHKRVVSETNTGESRQGGNTVVAPELMTRVSTCGILSVWTAYATNRSSPVSDGVVHLSPGMKLAMPEAESHW